MSTFCKEYDVLADAIITNAIVMPAVELNEGEKSTPQKAVSILFAFCGV